MTTARIREVCRASWGWVDMVYALLTDDREYIWANFTADTDDKAIEIVKKNKETIFHGTLAWLYELDEDMQPKRSVTSIIV